MNSNYCGSKRFCIPMTVAKYKKQLEIPDWQKMERYEGKFENPLECLRKREAL